MNACLVALAVAAIPGVWIFLDLLRTAVDDAALGRAFQAGPTAFFMRYALTLPERITEEPIVLLRGFAVTRTGLGQALIAALITASVAAGAFLAASGLIRAEIGRRALGTMQGRILDGIASAPTSALESVRRVAVLASDSLAAQRSFFERAVGQLAVAGALLFACLGVLGALDLWFVILAAIGLSAFGWADAARMRLETKLRTIDLAADDALRRALSELAGHLPAVSSHGTADLERRRITAEIAPIRHPGEIQRRSAVLLRALAAGLAFATVAAVLGAGAWFGLVGRLSPGQVAAAALAAALAVAALDRLVGWRIQREAAARLLADIAGQLGAFRSRRREGATTPLPASGLVVADNVVVRDGARGGPVAGLDLSFPLPSHVALVGGPDSGAGTVAGLIGGQLVGQAGHVTFGGVEIGEADPADRAKRLAFCGGDTLLLAGTLRANLLYGCRDPEAADIDERIASALSASGLSEFVYRRGLSGTVDPKRAPSLTASIVTARAAVRAELERSGIPHLVQPFEAERYNPHATIGENILFGVSVGDTFREENLAAHPFMRALLDREGLTAVLAELGTAIVRNDLEIFRGLPSRSAVVDRFSLLSGPERESFEGVLARQTESQRKAASARDTARLVGLAMRYSENRHRLGLVGPDLEARILRLRQAFAREIPKSLEPSVEFFRPDRICAATSVLDNLLFGRIAEDLADARPQVLAAVHRVLDQLNLAGDVTRVGLQARIDPNADAIPPACRAAIDLARCLVRQPDNLVVEHALDGLPPREARALVGRLRAAMSGRGLVIVAPDPLALGAELFDKVVTFKAGKALSETSSRAGQPTSASLSRPGAGSRVPAPEPTWSQP